MLKVFDREGKVNFVDDKNMVVGYDMNRHCCEKASWSFSRVSDGSGNYCLCGRNYSYEAWLEALGRTP
jgi:hypothetical protein